MLACRYYFSPACGVQLTLLPGGEIVAEEYRPLTDAEWWAIVAPICGIPVPKQSAEDTGPKPVTDEESDDQGISVSDSGLEVPAVDSQE